MIRMETLNKVRFVMPEIIVIDGKMYKPIVAPADNVKILPIDLGIRHLALEKIISEDEDGER